MVDEPEEPPRPDPLARARHRIEDPKAAGLTELQAKILAHVLTFQISTLDAVHELFFPTKGREGTKSALRRLRERGLIDTAALTHNTHYFFLKASALQLFSEPVRRVGRRAPGPLAESYGILEFCRRARGRSKITKAEFTRLFPHLAKRNMPAQNFYLDHTTGEVRLGHIYVDRGGAAFRVPMKFDATIDRFRKYEEWRKLINDRSLTMAVVTSTEQKADQIREALDASRGSKWSAIHFCFETVPELLPIVDRRSRRS